MHNNIYSIVIPVYNEETVVAECYKRVKAVCETLDSDYEIIFINDGSRDRTEIIVDEICNKDKKVKLINFSRNFGHQIAITAGMDFSIGEAVVIIDADLQDPPEMIPKMIAKYREGYDVVYAVRKKRKGESLFKKVTAAGFYRFFRRISDIDMPVDTGDFRLISRNVCDSLKELKERNRFVRGLVSWVGYKQIGIGYERDERFAGHTKYPLKKMIKFSIDGITAFSAKPLRMWGYLGGIIAFSGFIYSVYILISKIIFNNTVPGWASLIVITMLIGGLNMISIGILGEYISRIYEETKARPIYIVSKHKNFTQQGEDDER